MPNLRPTLLLLCLTACAGAGSTAPQPSANSAVAPMPETETLGVPWIEDDYAAALSEAKRLDKPLVIDMWAEWCHTCLSMKHTVLVAPEVVAMAPDFIWLAVNTDKPENAAVLENFSINAWPTFFIVDGTSERARTRFTGAASLPQFMAFLADGRKSGATPGSTDSSDHQSTAEAATILQRAEVALAAGETPAAIGFYEEALTTAPADWARRPDILVALISVLKRDEQWSACADLAVGSAVHAGLAASSADFLYYAGACAKQLEDSDRRQSQITEMMHRRFKEILAVDNALLSMDDRSDAMRLQREALLSAGASAEATRVATAQRALLDQAAAQAPTPYAASTYNWPRAEVYVFLNIAEELVPHLEASEAALPEQFDPPYRLAWIQHKLGRHDAALAAVNRSLQLAYGPRKARVESLLAEIHQSLGNSAAELKAHQSALATLRGLPKGQRKAKAEKAVEETIKALKAGQQRTGAGF